MGSTPISPASCCPPSTSSPTAHLPTWFASLDRTGRRLARVDETSRVEVVDIDEQGSGVAPTVLPTSADVVQFSPLDDRLHALLVRRRGMDAWDTAGSPQEIAELLTPGNDVLPRVQRVARTDRRVDEEGNGLPVDADGE